MYSFFPRTNRPNEILALKNNNRENRNKQSDKHEAEIKHEVRTILEKA